MSRQPCGFGSQARARLSATTTSVGMLWILNRSTIPTPGLGELVGGETVAQAPVNAQMLRSLLQDAKLPVAIP